MVQAITILYWGDNEPDGDELVIFQEPDPEVREQLVRDEEDPGLRDFYMKQQDFIQYGHTNGCPKCSIMIEHPHNQGGPPSLRAV